MDGQEWFLNDSARWHQSFEAWTGPGPNSPSVFMFGNDRVASASPGSSGAGTNGVTGQGTTARNSAVAAASASESAMAGGYGFEGLGMSLQDGGWLPQLD